MVNFVPEMFVMVCSSDVKRFGLERVKEFCVSNSVFDNMIHSFEKLEPGKLFDQKRFHCGNDINFGLVLSFEKFMEHNKSFDHHEKMLELVLKQSDSCFSKPCDSSVFFKENGFVLSCSKYKLAIGDL